MDAFISYCIEHKYRIGLTAAGFLIAVLWITIGFFKTMLLLILAAAGFALGYRLDAPERFKELIEKYKPERFK